MKIFKRIMISLLIIAILLGAGAGTYYALKYHSLIDSEATEPGLEAPVETPRIEVDLSEYGIDGHNDLNTLEVKGGYLISTDNYSTAGILYYDKEAKTVTQLYKVPSGGYDWRFVQKVEGGVLISAANSHDRGILFFDETLKTIEKVYEEGYGWVFSGEVKGGCLLSATDDKGILYYDYTKKNFEKKYELGDSWAYFMEVTGGLLIGGISSSNGGLLYYDEQLMTIENVYSSGYNWAYSQEVEGGFLIGSKATEKGVLYFDAETKTVEKKHEIANIDTFYKVKGGYLLTSTSRYVSIYFFDESTKEITKCNGFESDKYYGFKEINDGALVWGEQTLVHFTNSDHATKKLLRGLSPFDKIDVEDAESGWLVRAAKENREVRYFIDADSFTIKMQSVALAA